MKSGKSIIMAVLAAMLAFSSCEKEKEQLSFGSDDHTRNRIRLRMEKKPSSTRVI